MIRRPCWVLLGAAACAGGSPPGPPAWPRSPTLTAQVSGTTQRLQAVSPVSDSIVWVSGTGGTYARTRDGGRTWHVAIVPGADSLEFRDVHGIDAGTAYLLSAGPGDRSRIYQTTDSGAHWTLQFTSPDSAAFYDCFDFWDARHGLAISDAVNGTFPIMITDDGGRHWTRLAQSGIPAAQPGEGLFAASGACLVTGGSRNAWFGTGASEGGAARVFRTEDRGVHWTATVTPVSHGTKTSGITSLGFHDLRHGLAVGGEIANADPQRETVAVTDDGGRHWSLAGQPTFPGAIYGAAWTRQAATGAAVVAVGPKGAAYSTDAGRTWTTLDTTSYWSVAFANRDGWMVGPEGRIVRVRFQ